MGFKMYLRRKAIELRLLRSAVLKLFIYIALRVICAPLSFVLRRLGEDKKKIVFIGGKDGKFLDNSKYLYLFFCQRRKDLERRNISFWYLTKREEVLSMLKKEGLPVVKYNSLEGIYLALTADLVVIDSIPLFSDLWWHTSSKKIQLWHGIPLKKIELAMKHPIILRILNLLNGRYPKYDVLVSTSPFVTQHCFSPAFRFKDVWETGYPRNDVLFELMRWAELNADVETIEDVRKRRRRGERIAVYMPTFRDTGGDPISDGCFDLEDMNYFLRKNNISLVVKFHTFLSSKYKKEEFSYDHILFYESMNDIYPLLPLTDLLITDYSSIYFDYLLLDKPIVFYPYDLEKYISYDREFFFEYSSFTPGEKVFGYDELKNAIFRILVEGDDRYKEDRRRMRERIFSNVDGKSCERLYKKIIDLI